MTLHKYVFRQLLQGSNSTVASGISSGCKTVHNTRQHSLTIVAIVFLPIKNVLQSRKMRSSHEIPKIKLYENNHYCIQVWEQHGLI